MALSVTDTNPQQGGRKGKDKTKYVMVLVEDRLAEFTNTMSALTSRVEDRDKPIEELQSTGDMDELREEMQAAVSSVVANFKKELQAFKYPRPSRMANSKLTKPRSRLA